MRLQTARTFILGVWAVVFVCSVLGQIPSASYLADPLALPGKICLIKETDSSRTLRQRINQDLAVWNPDDASGSFCIAERMKRVGDYQAEYFYEKAIQADKSNPNYELFYADYLRNFRGAEAPLFPRAEEHYYSALTKVRNIPEAARPSRSGNDTESMVERGLIALYQQDGVPLASWQPQGTSASTVRRPFAFFSTVNRYQQSPADLDREADVRDYTSEALFAQSRRPNFEPLDMEELGRLIRNKEAFETFDRIRFRYRTWPSLDLFFVHRQTNNSQITRFDLPNIDKIPFNPESTFNELRQNDYGIQVNKPCSIQHYFDLDLTAAFRFVQRWGLIEFVPGAHENIPQFDSRAVFSRFIGPDKANLEVTYTYQWIQPDLPGFKNRYRDFFGATATYQIFRPIRSIHRSSYQNRFTARGWDFFAGFLLDNEVFIAADPANNTHPKRRDYFVGTSLKGFLFKSFDLSFRPTWFTSDVKEIGLQKNSQLRTDITTLIRLVDEDAEERKGIPGAKSGTHLDFVHLVGGLRQDFSRTGLDAFENRKFGVGIDTAFYTTAKRITYLASVRYDQERYFRLDRNANIISATFSIGF